METTLYELMRSDQDLAGKLAKWNDNPAIFYVSAPPDTDKRWAEKQYPRLDYYVDPSADPERGTNGALIINIWCDQADVLQPEDIEGDIRILIQDVFLKPENGPTFACTWNTNRGFTAGDRTKPINGLTLVFDFYEFPETRNPKLDPCKAVADFMKEISPGTFAINRDELPSQGFRPSATKPAIYVRTTEIQIERATFQAAFFDVRMKAHIFSSDTETRYELASLFLQKVALNNERIPFEEDGSWIEVENMNLHTGSDYMGAGQINISGTFGILKDTEDNPLEKVEVSYIDNKQKSKT